MGRANKNRLSPGEPSSMLLFFFFPLFSAAADAALVFSIAIFLLFSVIRIPRARTGGTFCGMRPFPTFCICLFILATLSGFEKMRQKNQKENLI